MEIQEEHIKRLTIQEWAIEDRPREKLMQHGQRSLSDAELMAILLGTGTRELTAVDLGKLILAEAGNDLHTLAKMSLKELMRVKGIGEAKAITIAAAMELGRRRKEADTPKEIILNSSKALYNAISPDLLDQSIEEFWLLLLNNKLQLQRKILISKGGVTATLVDPKVVFQKALEYQCPSMAVVHNHPSGSLTPSAADDKLTQKLKQGCNILDITLIDHLIFTDKGYYSYADEGRL